MIATYAILSPISRLRLRLNMYRQLVLGAVAVTFVGFLEFFFELKSIAPNSLSWVFTYFGFQEQSTGFSNQEAAFLVVVAWLISALLLHASAKPRAISLANLKTLSERLHDEGRYLELVELVGPYLETIRRAAEKRLLGQHFHHWILDTHQKATNPFLAILNDDKLPLPKWLARRIKPLASLVPARRKARHAAVEIEDLMLQSESVRQLLVRLKPDFAMEFMDRMGWEHDEFRTRFFSWYSSSWSVPKSRVPSVKSREGSISSEVGAMPPLAPKAVIRSVDTPASSRKRSTVMFQVRS